MHDSRCLAFADVSTAMDVCAIHLSAFVASNDKAQARKYLDLVSRVSEALTLLSGADEAPAVGVAILRSQEVLVAAHREFTAHVEALLTAHRATVCA